MSLSPSPLQGPDHPSPCHRHLVNNPVMNNQKKKKDYYSLPWKLTTYLSGRCRERTDAADLIYGALLDIIGLEIPLPNRK